MYHICTSTITSTRLIRVKLFSGGGGVKLSKSILMSLPPHVQWVYDHHPEPGSKEEKLLKVLAKPIEWI